MTVFGHVAFAYVATRYRSAQLETATWAMVGALLPDMIDKPLHLLGLFPWGRTIGHSVFFWALTIGFVLLIDLFVRRLPGYRWVLFGAMTHLIADLTDDIVAGFQFGAYALTSWGLWPVATPDDWDWVVVPLGYIDPGITTYEIAFLIVAVLLLVNPRRLSPKRSEVEPLS